MKIQKVILRYILAIAAGFIAGSIINMLFVNLGHAIFPVKGLNPDNPDAIKQIMQTLDYKYFLFPFVAHALGTLAGAFVAARIALKNKMNMALVIGGLFLIGGMVAAFMIPAPMWFIVLDLIVAYLPMAWIGGKLSGARFLLN